jgi:hypothetical protein
MMLHVSVLCKPCRLVKPNPKVHDADVELHTMFMQLCLYMTIIGRWDSNVKQVPETSSGVLGRGNDIWECQGICMYIVRVDGGLWGL